MSYSILSEKQLSDYSLSISKSHLSTIKIYQQNRYSIKQLMINALDVSGEKYVTEPMAKSVIRTYHILNPSKDARQVGIVTAKFSNYLNELRGVGFPYREKIGDFIDYIYGKAEELIKSPYNTGTKDIVLGLLDMVEDIQPIYDDLSKNLNIFKRILSYAENSSSADIRLTDTYQGIAERFMEIRKKSELPESILNGKFMKSIAVVLSLISENNGKPDKKQASKAVKYIDDAIFEAMMFDRKYKRYKMIRNQVDRIIT